MPNADRIVEQAAKQAKKVKTSNDTMFATTGDGDAFRNGKYNIENYSYPSDIMSPLNPYGGNYAIFYINVATDSKLLSKSNKFSDTVEDIPTRLRGELLAKDRTKTGLAGTVAGAGAFVGAIGGGILTGNISGAAKGAGYAGAGSGIVAASVATQAASATRAQKRLKTAIALHIPNQLNIRYSTNWEAEDTLAFQATEDIIKATMNGGGASTSGATAKLATGLKNGGGVAADVIANVGMSKVPGGAAMSAATGLAANPKKEQVFKGVDYRTFMFDYQFFPRDEKEAQNVMEIIRQFKYHMHPEFKQGSNNYLYIYPSEFDISYYTNGEENLNIHRHTSCVLYEMNVNYTPNGQFTSFANGMPTQINIQLGFRELGLLTKDLVKEGL